MCGLQDATGSRWIARTRFLGKVMAGTKRKSREALEAELAELRLADDASQRQVALLTAIVSIFRETANCQSEDEMAQVCLKAAEDLTGSAYSFIGELNDQGRFDTTMVSEAGWRACKVPMPEALQLLMNMPNRGINRMGLKEHRSWIINDVAQHPEAVEKPQGHPQLDSFLGVPLRYAGGTLGMIALANKPSGYSKADQDDVEALAVAFTESLNRRRAEKRVGELNEALSRHVRQVEAANKELENFSYSISHDLRAPARHISGYLELLDKQNLTQLDEKSRHYLQVIAKSAQRMGLLIDGLLSFLHLGRNQMHRTLVDLGQLAREVAQDLTQDLAQNQAQDLAEGPRCSEVVWQIAPLPLVMGDRAMLRTVLANLMANALKFCGSRPRPEVEVGAVTDRSDEVLCFVKDNGVGFDMRYQDKLFGLFQRLHSQEEFEGTGVGLASVQRIIVRHGGRVWASGELGKGATFWFSLPKIKEEMGP
jgi:signal transduction histidine kinase